MRDLARTRWSVCTSREWDSASRRPTEAELALVDLSFEGRFTRFGNLVKTLAKSDNGGGTGILITPHITSRAAV